VFNKADRLSAEAREALLQRHPEALVLSAHSPDDVAALRQTVIEFFERSMVEADLVIPYTRQARISEVYENARVLSEAFDESGRRLKLRALPAAMARLTRAFET
jgi:GTP-binding protein HflX